MALNWIYGMQIKLKLNCIKLAQDNGVCHVSITKHPFTLKWHKNMWVLYDIKYRIATVISNVSHTKNI
jgi:hypothetical protein